MDSYRANRQYERLVFEGIPEHPETIYQRSTYSNVDERITGKSLLVDDSDLYDEPGEQVIATIIYQPDLGQVKIIKGEEEIII